MYKNIKVVFKMSWTVRICIHICILKSELWTTVEHVMHLLYSTTVIVKKPTYRWSLVFIAVALILGMGNTGIGGVAKLSDDMKTDPLFGIPLPEPPGMPCNIGCPGTLRWEPGGGIIFWKTLSVKEKQIFRIARLESFLGKPKQKSFWIILN